LPYRSSAQITYALTTTLIFKVKGRLYVALYLSILLYGSKISCLLEDLFNRLCHFHHRCAQTMGRITIAHLIRNRISSISLLKRFLLRMDRPRRRMPFTHAPRIIVTCWVDNPRPRGCPTKKLGPNSDTETFEHVGTRGSDLGEERPSTSNRIFGIARDCDWSKSMACCLCFLSAERNKRNTDLPTTRHLG
jgi:hypothetical protein